MSIGQDYRLVSVIVPTRNRSRELLRCLESVYRSDYPRLEVIVVDDASIEPIERSLSKRFPRVTFVRNETRLMLSCSRNRGAARSTGSYLFFLDDDNVIAPDTIRLLAQTLDESERTAVSVPVIFYLARVSEVWTSYISRSRLPGFYTLHTDIPASESPTFSFHNSFMVKKDAFKALGGFDAQDFPIRFGEVDLAHRLREKGYGAVLNPNAKDWHDLGWSLVHVDAARAYYTERNRIVVIKKYFQRRDLAFFVICILPFVGTYQLLHHVISTRDGRIRTASAFLRGLASGLAFETNVHGRDRTRRVATYE